MFDLDAYLRRVGHAGPRHPTLATLTALCAAQPAAIAFENVDALLGRPPVLALDALQAKLVGRRRGGYCYELNLLLREALIALGFDVSALAARVVWMKPADAPPTPRSHMLLKVDLPGTADAPPASYIADAGFGSHVLGAPLRLQPDVVQPTFAGVERIVAADSEFTVEAQLPDGWTPLYRFSLQALHPVDFEPLNWYTATRPGSLFGHNLMLERLTAQGRAALLNDRLTLHPHGGARAVRRIGDADDFARVLDEVFDLAPPVPAEVLFARVPRGLDDIHLPA